MDPTEVPLVQPGLWASLTMGTPRRGLSPAAPTPRDLPLLVLAVVAALSSIAALLLQWAGWVRMPFTVTFISLPGLLLMGCLGVWAGRTGRELLLNRLQTGVVAGGIGLVGYDLIRLGARGRVSTGHGAAATARRSRKCGGPESPV